MGGDLPGTPYGAHCADRGRGSHRQADTAVGLVVVAHHDRPDLPDTLKLIDPNTGALRRRLAKATPLGAAGHLILVSLPDCGAALTHATCTLEAST